MRRPPLSLRRAALSLLLATLPLAGLGAPAVAGKAVMNAEMPEPVAGLRIPGFPAALEQAMSWPALAPRAKAASDPEDKRMRVGIARDAAARSEERRVGQGSRARGG